MFSSTASGISRMLNRAAASGISFCIALMVASSLAVASPLVFPEYNYSIDPPAGWVAFDAKNPKVQVAVARPDGMANLIVAVSRSPESELAGALGNMIGGLKASMKAKSWQIEPDQKTIQGSRFFVIVHGHDMASGETKIFYVTIEAANVYVIIFHADGAMKMQPDDPTILSTVSSFKLLTAQPVSKQFSFPEHSFSIGVPENWVPSRTQSPQAQLAMKSPTRPLVLMAIATKVPRHELPNPVPSLKKSMAASGWEFGQDQQSTFGGQSFSILRALSLEPNSDGIMIIYFTSAGEEIYMMNFVGKKDLVANDPDILSIMQSFHLTNAVAPQPPNAKSGSEGK